MQPGKWQSLFEDGAKPLIGMIHLRALPGSPSHDFDGGVAAITKAALADSHALEQAGFDAVLFVNEADAPYTTSASPTAVAAMSAVVTGARPTGIPFGVEFLFDPIASLACAIASDAAFIRGGVIGAWQTTSGLRVGGAAELLRARMANRAEHIGIFSTAEAEMAFPLNDSISPAERIRMASHEKAMDAVLLSGTMPGVAVPLDGLQEAKQAMKGRIPVLANSGVRAATVSDVLSEFDGCLVGSDLKVNGELSNPIDPDRARRFVAAARSVKKTLTLQQAG